MSTALVAFPAAPLDRTARMVTRGVWLLALAVSPADPAAFLDEVSGAA